MKIKTALRNKTVVLFCWLVGSVFGINEINAEGWTASPNPIPQVSFQDEFLFILRWFLGFILLTSILLIIVGSFLYLLSRKNIERKNKAKKIVKYSCVILIFTFLAYALALTPRYALPL